MRSTIGAVRATEITKNHLAAKDLEALNRIGDAYLEFAETPGAEPQADVSESAKYPSSPSEILAGDRLDSRVAR